MRFKIDENLHPAALGILADAGHDAVTVIAQGLRGRPDSDIARVCQKENRVLITLDKDFADIRTYPPAEYPGIIVCRLASQSRSNVLAIVSRLVRWIGQYPLAEHLWIVDEGELRIRGEDASSR